jgi:hypothetical protein
MYLHYSNIIYIYIYIYAHTYIHTNMYTYIQREITKNTCTPTCNSVGNQCQSHWKILLQIFCDALLSQCLKVTSKFDLWTRQEDIHALVFQLSNTKPEFVLNVLLWHSHQSLVSTVLFTPSMKYTLRLHLRRSSCCICSAAGLLHSTKCPPGYPCCYNGNKFSPHKEQKCFPVRNCIMHNTHLTTDTCCTANKYKNLCK